MNAEAATAPVGDFARFSIGYVCGDRRFFHPSAAAITEFDIRPENLREVVASTRRIRAKGLFTSELPDDAKSHLFLPTCLDLTNGERDYLREGVRRGVDSRYKCRIRDPWYRVPGVTSPDLILSVFSDTPVLLANDGGLLASNSLLCGTVSAGVSASDVVRSWYSSLTLLSIEFNVHALGGGVFVFVPRETGRIRVARLALTESVDLADISQSLQTPTPQAAYEVGDACLLAAGVLRPADLDAVLEARRILRRWRRRSRV